MLGLSLHFESPVAFFSTPVANLLLCGWIQSTTGNFTCTSCMKGKSSIHSGPLMTALHVFAHVQNYQLYMTGFVVLLKVNKINIGQCVRSWSERSGFEPWPGDIVLCSWARHFTLTEPLSTQEYKWVPAICWGNLTNCGEVTCDGLTSRPGGVEILLAASCYWNRDKLRQYEPVWLIRLHSY